MALVDYNSLGESLCLAHDSFSPSFDLNLLPSWVVMTASWLSVHTGPPGSILPCWEHRLPSQAELGSSLGFTTQQLHDIMWGSQSWRPSLLIMKIMIAPIQEGGCEG